VLPPARSPFPSASGGRWAFGCVGERWLSFGRCRLGTSSSRVWFPAAASRRRRRRRHGIRSSRSLPRPDGAPLRRRRRGCGGGASSVMPLFRSRPPVIRRLVSLLAFVVEDGATVQGPVVVGGVDLRSFILRRLVSSPASLDPGTLVLGRAPGRCFFSVCFILLFGASVYCGSFKASRRWSSGCPVVGGVCPPAMVGGDGLRWMRPAQGLRDLLVIFLFSGACVLVCRICCALYPLLVYLYLYPSLYYP